MNNPAADPTCAASFDVTPPVSCTLAAGHAGNHVGYHGPRLTWNDLPAPEAVEDTDTLNDADWFQRNHDEVMADPERRKKIEDFFAEPCDCCDDDEPAELNHTEVVEE